MNTGNRNLLQTVESCLETAKVSKTLSREINQNDVPPPVMWDDLLPVNKEIVDLFICLRDTVNTIDIIINPLFTKYVDLKTVASGYYKSIIDALSELDEIETKHMVCVNVEKDEWDYKKGIASPEEVETIQIIAAEYEVLGMKISGLFQSGIPTLLTTVHTIVGNNPDDELIKSIRKQLLEIEQEFNTPLAQNLKDIQDPLEKITNSIHQNELNRILTQEEKSVEE